MHNAIPGSVAIIWHYGICIHCRHLFFVPSQEVSKPRDLGTRVPGMHMHVFLVYPGTSVSVGMHTHRGTPTRYAFGTIVGWFSGTVPVCIPVHGYNCTLTGCNRGFLRRSLRPLVSSTPEAGRYLSEGYPITLYRSGTVVPRYRYWRYAYNFCCWSPTCGTGTSRYAYLGTCTVPGQLSVHL